MGRLPGTLFPSCGKDRSCKFWILILSKWSGYSGWFPGLVMSEIKLMLPDTMAFTSAVTDPGHCPSLGIPNTGQALFSRPLSVPVLLRTLFSITRTHKNLYISPVWHAAGGARILRGAHLSSYHCPPAVLSSPWRWESAKVWNLHYFTLSLSPDLLLINLNISATAPLWISMVTRRNQGYKNASTLYFQLPSSHNSLGEKSWAFHFFLFGRDFSYVKLCD